VASLSIRISAPPSSLSLIPEALSRSLVDRVSLVCCPPVVYADALMVSFPPGIPSFPRGGGFPDLPPSLPALGVSPTLAPVTLPPVPIGYITYGGVYSTVAGHLVWTPPTYVPIYSPPL
jgi:hypothetical protein